MARLIPNYCNPSCISIGEKIIFEAIQHSHNSDDWIVFHSLNIAKHVRNPNGEADFVVIAPKLGVMVIEIKACKSIRLKNGLWYYGNANNPDYRGPFLQADDARRSLMRYISEHAPECQGIPFFHAVIFTHCRFEYKSPEWREWQFIDCADFSKETLIDNIKKIFYEERKHLASSQKWFSLQSLSPTIDEAQYLSKLFKPHFYVIEKLSDKLAKVEHERIRLTDEQYDAISYLGYNPRILFTGPAGTGKTLLALEAAKWASCQGKNTLFLCYNIHLAEWLAEQTKGITNLNFIRLYQLMKKIANIDIPNDADNHFWKNTLPLVALEAVLRDGISQYDFMIMDEAQDILSHENIDFLDSVLKNELSNGEWCFFGDFDNQNLYSPHIAHVSHKDVLKNRHYSTLPLTINCRNVPSIASFIESICNPKPSYTGFLKTDDDLRPEVSYYSSEDNQIRTLERILESLLLEVDPSEIIILSPNNDNDCIASKVQGFWKDQIAPYSHARNSQVRYLTIHSFKGLESSIIILTDIEELSDDLLKSLFYVGASRAKDKLQVLAHRKLQNVLQVVS